MFVLDSFAKKENSQKTVKDLRPVKLNLELMEKIKKRGGFLISDKIGDYILRAESLSENKKYDEAIDFLKYHYDRADRLSQIERADLAFHLATTYKLKGNNRKALEFLQKALDFEVLAYNKHLSLLFLLAEIYIDENKIRKGESVLMEWFSINENPHLPAYVLLAYIYYNRNQLNQALKYVEYVLSLSLKPKENWLNFVISIYVKKNKYKKAQPYLEKLVALFPQKANHWRQLVGIYLHLNDYKKAFITLEMAYKMGHLNKETEFFNLASLYVDQGLPYQSARFLEEKINTKQVPFKKKYLEFLAEVFYQAREGDKALEYFKKASKLAKDSNFFIRYGQRLLQEEKWKEAEEVLKKILTFKDIKETIESIEKYKKLLAQQKKDFEANFHTISEEEEKLKAPFSNQLENVYLNLGIALYNQKDYASALTYFKKAIEVDDTFLNAYQWIDSTELVLQELKQTRLSY